VYDLRIEADDGVNLAAMGVTRGEKPRASEAPRGGSGGDPTETQYVDAELNVYCSGKFARKAGRCMVARCWRGGIAKRRG